MEQEIVAEQKVLQEIKKPEKAENQSRQNGEHSPRKPEIIPAVSVRDQAQVFRNRPAVEKVDPSYRLKMKGASAVATRSDGSKFIGKIKLVKKAEQPPEEDAEEEALQRHGPDCVVPDVVKDRLSNYQEVVLRNKGSRVNEDLRYNYFCKPALYVIEDRRISVCMVHTHRGLIERLVGVRIRKVRPCLKRDFFRAVRIFCQVILKSLCITIVLV